MVKGYVTMTKNKPFTILNGYNEPNFVQTMTRPRNAPGPCDWKIEDWMDKKHRVYIKGTCRTYKETRGLVGRIAKAIHDAYRLGVKHGRHTDNTKVRVSL